MTDGIEVSFQPSMDGFILLEDVFTLIDKLGMKNPHKKPIVVLNEFQEIRTLDKNLDKNCGLFYRLTIMPTTFS